MNIQGLKVLVIGAGVSGIAAVKLLVLEGALPVLFDSNDKVLVEDGGEKSPLENIPFYMGSLPDKVAKSIDMVVVSPGVPLDNPTVAMFRGRHIKIWGEIELAYEFAKGRLMAVTGTNGKTTTVTLLGEIVKNYVEQRGSGKAFVVGNIGNPYTAEVQEMTEDSITVAEISSFQLETIEKFHPDVSAILNITPDHLNRHGSMENYVSIKKKIALNQKETDTIILNYDDPYTRAFGEETKAKVVYFSSKEEKPVSPDCLYLKDGVIYYNGEKVIETGRMKLLGTHNYENVMAAAGMALSFGIPMDLISETIRDFHPVEHRIEFVETVNGVDYYNDSKGTNPDAAIRAVDAMSKQTVLIAGGFDKHSKYDEWIEHFPGKIRLLVLMGQTAEDIESCARSHGFENIRMADSMEEAVQTAYREAEPGEAVLLSPACASWGMFRNYEERGRIFKEEVRKLS